MKASLILSVVAIALAVPSSLIAGGKTQKKNTAVVAALKAAAKFDTKHNGKFNKNEIAWIKLSKPKTTKH